MGGNGENVGMDSLTPEQLQELMMSLESGGLDGVYESLGLESQALMFTGLQWEGHRYGEGDEGLEG